jgi:hypothetical protein
VRWALVLLALACGLGLLVLPAGAAPSASGSVSIVVDESVAPGDGSTAAPPAGVASDEPIGTSDAVSVSPPADVPGTESVSVSDEVSVVPPVTIVVDESVSPSDAPRIVPPASVLAAETATVTDDVSIVPTSSPTSTTVTAGPNPAVAGAPVQLQAAVTSTGGAVGSGSVTFEDGATPLGPPVSVDATGHASLTVSVLALGSHTIGAAYGGSGAFLPSSAMTSEGIYDYALAAGPDRTALRGGDADYALTLSLDAGSATTGLPSNAPFSVGLLPGDASSNAPASIAFPPSPGSPTSLTVTVHTGDVTLGDVPLSFTAGARSATSGLHLYDYTLALAPASQTVQRGDTASFTLASSLALGSSSVGLPAAIGLTTSPGATAGVLALPGSAAVTVPTGPSTPAGAQAVTVTGNPGARTASATLYVNVPPVPSAGGPYTANEGSTLTLHGSAADTADETLTYAWDLGGGATATGASPTITVGDGPAVQPVKLTVCADHGACASDATAITILNVPPTATLTAPASAAEGSSATVSITGATDASAADVAAGLHYAIVCDGSSLAALTYASASTTPSMTCPAVDGPGDIAVRARVIDKDGGFVELTKTIHVTNVAPAATILAPAEGSVFRVGTHVALSGSFTDPGVLDTHTAVWTAGGATIPATVTEHGGSGSAAATWTPSAAGLYPLSLTVTDKDAGTTTVSGGTLVVFDPAAGSVSGAGSLVDPSHDLVLFDFEARYRDHDSVPSGHVELHVPHLTLLTTDLDWLVVTSPSFVLQGHGIVLDHHGSYRFRLTGVTGHPDQLRVQIWSPGGSLVYDSKQRPLRFGDIRISRS